jgi:hypothetical protein
MIKMKPLVWILVKNKALGRQSKRWDENICLRGWKMMELVENVF